VIAGGSIGCGLGCSCLQACNNTAASHGMKGAQALCRLLARRHGCKPQAQCQGQHSKLIHAQTTSCTPGCRVVTPPVKVLAGGPSSDVSAPHLQAHLLTPKPTHPYQALPRRTAVPTGCTRRLSRRHAWRRHRSPTNPHSRDQPRHGIYADQSSWVTGTHAQRTRHTVSTTAASGPAARSRPLSPLHHHVLMGCYKGAPQW
jgi:hypothetical protein